MNHSGSDALNESSRFSSLRNSYNLAIHSLLRSCSKEDFRRTFSSFNDSECDQLYQLYLKVMPFMYDNAKDEFENICLDSQVLTVLATIEQLTENQQQDALDEDKASLDDVRREVERAKLKEIRHLENCLQEVEAEALQLRKRVEFLRSDTDCPSQTNRAHEKLKDYDAMIEKILQ